LVTKSDAAVHWAAAMRHANVEDEFVFERARAHGLADGVSLGIVEPNGVRSFVSFASRDRFEPTNRVLAALKHIAIATHHRGRTLLSQEGELANDMRMTLSDRELDCLRLLREGCSNPQIARALCITPRTVQFHLRNAADKLGASGRTDTLARALRLGLIDAFA
jgi:LuxR family quorum-sensing system transcriptional regulator CciR